MDEGSDQEDLSQEPIGFTQEAKKRFIEGGPGFMGIVLLCLILGLAIAIERRQTEISLPNFLNKPKPQWETKHLPHRTRNPSRDS